MSQSVLPIKIRPHLIPFFHEEFEAIDAKTLNKSVRACKISMESSLGFLIRLSVEKTELPAETKKLCIFISVSDHEGQKKYTAKMYKHVSGKYSFLCVSPLAEKQVNDHLEDVFRVAFIYYMIGALEQAPDSKVKSIILRFMVKYELDNYGYVEGTLRSYYNREIKRGTKLRRVQTKLKASGLNT